ncbi:MAG: alpha-galactosidase [bacterium]|nr:alpha-galactosidase [bacterium]
MTGDRVILAPGESLEFEPVYLGADQDPVAGLNRYARAAAEITPPLVWNGDRPWGWASWYYYYSQVKEEDLVENLDFVREELSAYGFNLVQLDDGYMPRWGEWTNNSKFPSGLTGVAAEIESAGLRPGIWIAPFLVSMDSNLVDNHPDWFLHDQNGGMIAYQQPPSATHAILDVTHPDAEAWLRGVIGGIRDAGFRMIKIDFIFAEAFEGVRHDLKVTSMQAYHRGLEIIRESAGEDMFILACGASMLPTLGHAHAFRTGPDIAYEAVGGGNPSYNFLVQEARNTASRFFTGGNWFLNAPDQLLLRGPLTLEEAKMSAVANVMAGGVFLLGDNLAGLTEDRLAIATDPVILEIAKVGKPAVPLDLFNAASQKLFSSPVMDLAGESTAPSIWWLKGPDREGYLAFFNWEEDARDIGVETGFLNLSSPRKIEEVFLGEKVKVEDGKISARVESRQVKLFKISY